MASTKTINSMFLTTAFEIIIGSHMEKDWQ